MFVRRSKMRMEELKEKLEGVYNFDNPEHCQKVIEMLLRDLERANKSLADTQTQLKMLAYLTAANKGRAIEKANDILSGVPRKTKVEVWDMLVGMTNEMHRAKGLDDEELLDEVTSGIWSDLHMDSRESAVLEELLRRYRDKAGVENAIPDKVS